MNLLEAAKRYAFDHLPRSGAPTWTQEERDLIDAIVEAERRIPTTITTRETCQMCHRPSPVGFSVPNDVWRAAVHEHWWHGPLCIMCFARSADERGIEWDCDIVFCPVSFVTHCRGDSPMAKGMGTTFRDGKPEA